MLQREYEVRHLVLFIDLWFRLPANKRDRLATSTQCAELIKYFAAVSRCCPAM